MGRRYFLKQGPRYKDHDNLTLVEGLAEGTRSEITTEAILM